MTNNHAYVPWRDRAFVTIAEAAEIVARSPDWIRHRVGEGRLQARQITPGGPAVIVVGSLLALIDDAAVGAAPVRPTRKLYLAFSNP